MNSRNSILIEMGQLERLSIKGKITERWLVEREGIFFLIEGIFSNQERAWLPD